MVAIKALAKELRITRPSLTSKIRKLQLAIITLELPDRHGTIRRTGCLTDNDADRLRKFYQSRVV